MTSALRSDYIYDTNMQSTCTLHVHIHTCIRTDIVAQVCAAAARAVARAALSSCLAYSNVSGACARKQRDAAKEAEDLLANAKHEADLLRKQAEKDLAETLARREKAALEKIAQAEAHAVQDVRAQAVDIAMAATAKLLSENVDPARDQAMVDQAIKDLGQKLH